MLPNSIIVNLEVTRLGLSNLGDFYNERDGVLDVGKLVARSKRHSVKQSALRGKVAFVIDGQHRLRAFEFARSKQDFPLVVTALVDLSLARVAEIFVKINYFQKPVNKSLALDLLGISKNIFPKYYVLHEAVQMLNDEIDSPFYNKIKMLGLGKGFISQASLIGALEKYKTEKVFRDIGLRYNARNVYDVLWNYFSCVAAELSDFWGDDRFLSKTIGIRALIRLMRDLLQLFCKESVTFSTKNLTTYLRRINHKTIRRLATQGLGGEKGVNEVYAALYKDCASAKK